jgi:MFS family permease
MKELFQNRSFKLLFAGNLVSEIGNVLFGFVAGLYVQDITDGSPILFALFIALGAFVRLLFSPVAGVFVDRWDKVKIIYITDYIRGILFIAVAYVFFVGIDVNVQITTLLIVTVISGIISAFFGPAITSATPEIVGLDKVQVANGANSIIQSSTMILGVILGAAAFGLFDFTTAVLINGVSFMLSGFSEMFIKAEHKSEIPPHDAPNMLRDIRFGFAYLRKKEGLLRMMTYSLFLNFAFTPMFSVGIPFLFRTELGKGEWDIAWQNIAFGIAMMIAGIVVGNMNLKSMTRTIRNNLLLLSSSFILITAVIFILAEGIITYRLFYILILVLNVALAAFMMATNVPLNTGMIKVIDPEVRGRVFATIGAISGGAVPLAMFLAGPLIAVSSVSFLGIVCSSLLLIPTAGFLLDKKVTKLLNGIEGEVNGQLQEAV